jgi:Protein of unknown function (DUF3307)
MLTFFENLLIGHLIGDYILQNNWMAYRKGTKYLPCFVHCIIYTACVCSVTTYNPWWILVVFISHFPIDKYSLADKWLKTIHGRSLEVFLEKGHKDVPFKIEELKNNYIMLRGGFTSGVYIIVDNTFHFIFMLLGSALLKKLKLM